MMTTFNKIDENNLEVINRSTITKVELLQELDSWTKTKAKAELRISEVNEMLAKLK